MNQILIEVGWECDQTCKCNELNVYIHQSVKANSQVMLYFVLTDTIMILINKTMTQVNIAEVLGVNKIITWSVK